MSLGYGLIGVDDATLNLLWWTALGVCVVIAGGLFYVTKRRGYWFPRASKG